MESATSLPGKRADARLSAPSILYFKRGNCLNRQQQGPSRLLAAGLASGIKKISKPYEPALFFHDERRYLAFVVMTFHGKSPDFSRSFIAVFSTEPRGDIRSWSWTYNGKLTTSKEAMELNGESLTQIELAISRDGRMLALLTPEAWNPKASKAGDDAFYGIFHKGCAVVEIGSLERPALARDKNGSLVVRAYLYSSAASGHGPAAAAYEPASATGVLLTLREISSKSMSWSLHPTKFHP